MKTFINDDRQALGDVLLTGATGYLGVQRLKYTLNNYFGKKMLFVGQDIKSNQYVHSKLMAAHVIFEEIIKTGLNSKVLLVGNLSPRASDGKFQINFRTNNWNHLDLMTPMSVIPCKYFTD